MIAQAKSKREIMEWNVKFNDGMLKGIPGVQGSRPSLSAQDVQNDVKRYVNSMEEALSCQQEHIRSRGAVLQ